MSTLEKTSADYVIKKMKKISLPYPKGIIYETQLKEISSLLDEIEESVKSYRELVKNAKKIKK
ncbi:hypothetical protein [Arenibacter sp. F20364]|uniref:hypothetical protein n=1 Tax=Arenibacter sp. F20364 TaxID=2926415 RepID=UPI001FF20158|nr:hypothetical protein [Arenibacter sp. F20364]MCK0190966.1 hypothetical protein [Arenibacter sp. F20364]